MLKSHERIHNGVTLKFITLRPANDWRIQFSINDSLNNNLLTHSVLVTVKSSLKILVIFLGESTVYKMLEGELFFEY